MHFCTDECMWVYFIKYRFLPWGVALAWLLINTFDLTYPPLIRLSYTQILYPKSYHLSKIFFNEKYIYYSTLVCPQTPILISTGAHLSTRLTVIQIKEKAAIKGIDKYAELLLFGYQLIDYYLVINYPWNSGQKHIPIMIY